MADLTKVITIHADKVAGSSNLSNYRFLFKSTIADLKTTGNGGVVTNANGYDILFSSDEGGSSLLDHEIVFYDATTGQFIAWVLIPTVSYNTDTVIYLQAGDSGITTSQEDPAAVWSGYAGVWHLKENPTGSTGELIDSTSNANHGTGTAYPSSGTLPIQDDGKIYKGIRPYRNVQYTGHTGYVIVPDDPAIDMSTSDFSMSFWVKCANWDDSSSQYFVSKYDLSDYGYRVTTQSSGNNKMRIQLGDGSGTTFLPTAAHGLTNNTWAYFTITVDRDGDIIFYINGSQVGDPVACTVATDISNDLDMAFGANSANLGHPGNILDGIIEEVRLIKSILSPSLIATEYSNQNNPSGFYTVTDVGATTTTTTEPTTTTAETTTTTTLPELDSEGAIVWGEETPTEGETPIEWTRFPGTRSVTGDAEWGQLTLSVNEYGYSQVRSFPDAQARIITLTKDFYGSGSGTATLQIRGHASTPFLQDAVSPSWEDWTVPVEKAWKYIQVRVIKTS